MKKILIVLPVISLILVACGSTPSTPIVKQITPSSNIANTNPVNSAQKFSDSSDYQNAYLISGDTLSSLAQQALTGFELTKQILPDKSIQINLKAIESGYQDQNYTLQTGQQLYFVDKTLGDDRASELNQNDDYGVVVDAQGFIVK